MAANPGQKPPNHYNPQEHAPAYNQGVKAMIMVGLIAQERQATTPDLPPEL